MGTLTARFTTAVWRLISRLPPDVQRGLIGARWSVQLAVYRLSGRRRAYSPKLYLAGLVRQRLERSRYPGMTTLTERAYFKWHAQEEISGSGAILDLGCWLGSTTAALAMGLSANRRRAARSTMIHAYDLFQWDPRMAPHSGGLRLGPYAEGDSFRPEFDLLMSRWRDRIVVHEGDLMQESWSDGPIELLLVDAMKSWDLSTHILRHFYPALAPGASRLIHQDFSHCFAPWIPLISYRLLGYLTPVADIPGSESLVFRLVRPLPAEELNLTRSSFDEREIDQAFEYWLGRTVPEKHSGLRSARVLLAHYDGDAERADSMRRSLAGRQLLSEVHRTKLEVILARGAD